MNMSPPQHGECEKTEVGDKPYDQPHHLLSTHIHHAVKVQWSGEHTHFTSAYSDPLCAEDAMVL